MVVGAKRKGVAFLLALPPMGVFGLHRFYLGQRFRAILYFVLASGGLIGTIQDREGYQILIVLGIIAVIDAILMLAMPREDFDIKYNQLKGKAAKRYRQRKTAPTPQTTLYRTPERRVADPAIVRGINFYKKEHYAEAIMEFKKALSEDPQSAAAHFNLACCYSIIRNAEESYHHLARAVELGFDDKDRILQHEALSFLRSRNDFDVFRDNDYRLVQQLAPGSEKDLLEQARESQGSILDQLEKLGERLERGEMTRGEFDLEKKKLLGH